jgi:hypothetical protein
MDILSVNTTKDKLLGTWILASSEFRRSDGQVVYPFGKDAKGLIVYDAHGYFAAQLMSAHRPNFAVNDRDKGTPEELKATFEGYLGYFGTYEIDEQQARAVHHVLGSSFPNWEGGDQVRFFELDNDHLTLKTPPLTVGGVSIVGVLTWVRVGSNPQAGG